MSNGAETTVKCPVHKAWELGQGWRVIRLAALANAAALRTVRDLIDRRVASLERAARSEKPESVKIPIKEEHITHD